MKITDFTKFELVKGVQVVQELDNDHMRIFEIVDVTKEEPGNGGYITVMLSGRFLDEGPREIHVISRKNS